MGVGCRQFCIAEGTNTRDDTTEHPGKDKKTNTLFELAATRDSVLNISTPTTMPTISATASRTERGFFITE
jgi:hypothetical protein